MMEAGHVLRRALDFEFEGHGKKGSPKRTWKKQVEEESVKVGVIRVSRFLRNKVECWCWSNCCRVYVNLATLLLGILPDLKHWSIFL